MEEMPPRLVFLGLVSQLGHDYWPADYWPIKPVQRWDNDTIFRCHHCGKIISILDLRIYLVKQPPHDDEVHFYCPTPACDSSGLDLEPL